MAASPTSDLRRYDVIGKSAHSAACTFDTFIKFTRREAQNMKSLFDFIFYIFRISYFIFTWLIVLISKMLACHENSFQWNTEKDVFYPSQNDQWESFVVNHTPLFELIVWNTKRRKLPIGAVYYLQLTELVDTTTFFA